MKVLYEIGNLIQETPINNADFSKTEKLRLLNFIPGASFPFKHTKHVR